jgi:hypothetical protein
VEQVVAAEAALLTAPRDQAADAQAGGDGVAERREAPVAQAQLQTQLHVQQRLNQQLTEQHNTHKTQTANWTVCSKNQ